MSIELAPGAVDGATISTVRDFQTYQQEMQCLRKELGDIRGIIAANNFPSHREAGPKHHANQPHILAYKLSNHSP
jgi:hypothetical protein